MSQAPTSNTPLSQEASREEKAAILKVEADRAINTLRAMSSVLDPPAGGRFAKPSPPVDPAKLYAPLPASSPWHSDPVPNEEPLGFSVEDMPVMGEPFEVERAAAILEHSAATVSPPQGQSDEAGSSLPPPAMADLALHCLGRHRVRRQRRSPRMRGRRTRPLAPLILPSSGTSNLPLHSSMPHRGQIGVMGRLFLRADQSRGDLGDEKRSRSSTRAHKALSVQRRCATERALASLRRRERQAHSSRHLWL
jgi:hypothetical protein